MDFFDFKGTKFTILIGADGKPCWVAKELGDYLDRGRDALLRQAGSITGKWYFSYDGQSDDLSIYNF